MNNYDYVIYKPELNEETLAHYGVKGMKWKRKNTRFKKKVKINGVWKYIYTDDFREADKHYDPNSKSNLPYAETENGMRIFSSGKMRGENEDRDIAASSPKLYKPIETANNAISAVNWTANRALDKTIDTSKRKKKK